MAAFLGDIAFLLGVVVAVSGLFTLHKAYADPRPVLLKVAGIALLVTGIGTALCTSYFYLKYHFAGDLEHPYPAMMHGKDENMMMKKMMEQRNESKQPPMVLPDREDSVLTPKTPDAGHDTHH